MSTDRTSPPAASGLPRDSLASHRLAGQPSEHEIQWNDRLQDWLDGELDVAGGAAFEAHLAGCTICQRTMERFEQLDEALVAAAPTLALDANFDRQLMAQIETIDEKQRAEARRRIEQELQQQLSALRHGWKRTLAFVIPGIVAGIAIAFALTAWLDDSGVTRTLIAEGAAELGAGSTDFIRLGVTSIVGAGLGMLIAPWLARLSE